MKKILLFSCFILLYSLAKSQDCSNQYTIRKYAVSVDTGVFYGAAPLFDGSNDSLKMDIYKPIADGNTKRPLMVMLFGGGFFNGSRSDMSDLCQRYASRGYVAATIDYRLGFYNVIAYPYPYDQAEILRAAYRGLQDTRGAIRFLKGRADLDSSDTSVTTLLGASAGSIIALAAAYMDQDAEKPASSGATNPVLVSPRPDLGPIEGTLNLNGQNTNILAVVDALGAIIDTNYIQSPNDAAIYSYHQNLDPIVPCGYNQPYWGVNPGIPNNYPYVFGSCIIADRVHHLGYSPARAQEFIYDGDQHAVHDIDLIDSLSAIFLSEQICNRVLAVEAPQAAAPLLIYPNPAKNIITVASENAAQEFDFYNASGQLVKHVENNENNAVIDVSSFPRGIYFIKFFSENGNQSKTIILE